MDQEFQNANEKTVANEETTLNGEIVDSEQGDAVDTEQLTALRENLAALEGGRPHDYIKALVELAEALPPGEEKVELFIQAADLYTSKFKNQAEAVRAYEAILDVDPTHSQALDFLRDSYEKRRDWEKLIALRQREAEVLPPEERLPIYKEVAQLASDRIKKPSTCIELWAVVLQADPQDLDALRALSQLYERDREYEKLSDVLEKLVEITDDTDERIKLLQKLGQVTGDRLKDDARAAEAYRQLLIYAPDDRRYQEQLKKRYVALGRWDELEMFYAQTERWDEFIRVLESNESRTEDSNQRIAMLMKIAELWMTQKGKPERAVRAYEKILGIDSNHLPAAERLIPLYESMNNARGLTSALEVKLAHSEDEGERLRLVREAADLYAGRAGDKHRAYELWLEAFRLAPEEPQSQVDVEEAAKRVGQWQAVIEAYESAIEQSTDPIPLRLRLGRILVEETNQVDEALSHYNAVCEVEPDNAEALQALEVLFRSTGRAEDLLEVYQQRVELTAETEQRKAILFEMARLLEGELNQPQRAVNTYEEILREDASEVSALEALDALYQRTEQWAEYAEILRRRIELQTNEQAYLELKFRLAQAEEHKLGDLASALETYREVLMVDQGHAGAREALEGMLEGELRAEVAATLENIYEMSGQWERLIAVLAILVEESDEAERSAELYRKMAIVAANHLGDIPRAFEAQAKAVRALPAREDLRQELEDLAHGAQAWQPLQELYSAIAESLADPALARDYWLRLAAIQEHSGDIDEAAGSYERLLELDPTDNHALLAMDALFRGAERWKDLVQVYRKRIELTLDEGERERLHAEMAEVLVNYLDRPEQAIVAYRDVLTFAPASRIALGALDSLYTSQQRWADLADNLEARLEIEDDEQVRLELMLRLAKVREEQMGDVEGAVDGYRQILERDPLNEPAMSALERLAGDPNYELMIAEILEPLYRDQGNYESLIAVYEIQERREQDVHTRVGLLHQIALLYEDAASDANAAFETYCRALAVEPSNEETIQALDRLARATSRYEDLATNLQQLGEQQEDSEIACQLLARAAGVCEHDLGNAQRAIELYRKILAIEPTNLAAAEALQGLFQATSRFDETSLILQKKAAILDDPQEQKEALYQAATIEQDVLARPEQAIAVYHQVLEIDAEDIRSIDALIELYLQAEQWQQLLEVQAKKADLVFEPEAKKVILYQMGSVYESELQDLERAIDTYQRVLELDPDDFQALGRLDALYAASGNWNELLSVLTQEAELAADSDEAISYQYRIGELYERHLNDVDRAIELYQEILNIQPGHGPTLAALEKIKDGDQAPLAAAAVLEPVYEAMGEYERLIGALEVQAAHAGDVFQKVDLLHRIALLYEENLMAHAPAFETYARAVGCDSRNEESLAALERLAMALGRWEEVARLYQAELEDSDDPVHQVELGMRVAQLYEVQLDDLDSAVAGYRRVLEIDPENQGALRSLDRLFTQAERWDDLVGVLERQAEVGETPEDILELKYRLGQVRQHQLQDIDGAIAAYGEVLNAAPEHTASREALEGLFDEGVKQVEIGRLLEPLYQSMGEWEKLVQIHHAQLDHLEDPEERLQLFHRIAEGLETNLIDIEGAFEIYAHALAEHPLDERVGDELERLAASLEEGWVKLAVAYADVISQEGVSVDVQAALGRKLARVYEEELVDVDKAKESYRFVLSVAPQDAVALENLDRIYSSLEEWPELAEILERRAQAGGEVDEQVELLVRVGAVYEEQLSQLDDAERVLRRVFDELEPTNEQAMDALERIYSQKEAWEELARVYERQLEIAVGDVEEAETRAKMGRMSWRHLGRIDEAVSHWKRVLELRGEDGEALQGLADLYEHQGQWAELSDVLERHFDIADTDEERVLALSRRAKLCSEQLGRDDEALEIWNRVLDIDYSSVPALQAIAAIWRRREDHRELVASLHTLVERAAALLAAEELTEVYRELGKTYAEALAQPYEAAEAWNKLLEVDPGDFEAMEELEKIYRQDEQWEDVVRVKMQRAAALTEPEEAVREYLEVTALWRDNLNHYDGASEAFEKILEAQPLHDEAFAELEKLHRGAGRWENLIEVYLGRLEHVEELPARSDLWRRIARVFEDKLEDNEQAFVALDQAFKEDFHDDATTEYFGRMAHATGRWKDVIRDAQELLEQQTEVRDRIRLCLCLGKWNGEELGLMDYANAYYAQVVQMDPGNVQVLRQMANIYRLSGNWQKAGETLRQAEEAAVKNEDRKMIYVDLGDLLRKHMGEVAQSVVYYKRALAVDAHLLPALDALESIYGEQGEHNELAQVLRRKVEALSDADDLAHTRLRLAELYEKVLQEPEKAAEAYKNVVEVESSNWSALKGLERVYEGLEHWGDLVEVLQKQLNAVQSERDRVLVLMKLANLEEGQFLKADIAAEYLERVLELDPSQREAYEALGRCYQRLKQWEKLVETYQRQIAEAADHDDKVRLYGAIGEVFAGELNDVELAIEAYRNIIDLDDDNVEALDALARLYDKRGEPHEAIDCLKRVAELTTDGQQRVDMYYRIGRQQLDRLDDAYDARESFERALDLEPAHLPSITALRRIATSQADWDAAARYLEQEQKYTESARAKARLLVDLGRIREEHLGEHELALAAFEQAIEQDAECEEAAMPLLEHYVETARWEQAVPLAELLVRRARGQDRAEQHRLNNLLGRTYAALNRNDDALRAYQAAYQFDVTSQESIRGIAEVAFRLEDWPTALTNYQKVLTALGEDEQDERTEVYYRLGCIKREQGQVRQAVNNFEKALAINGEHRPTLDALVQVYEQSKDWGQVAEYKRQILDSLYDDEERFKLLVEIGDVWSAEADQPLKAIDALEEAQGLKPTDHVLLHKLLQLYQRAAEWQKMIDTIQAISELEKDPERKARYFYTMAQLYRDKIEDLDRAVELFNEALDLNPGLLEAFERINKILTHSKNWKQLERNYRKMLHRVAGKGKTELEHELWYQLGLVYRDRIKDRDKAIDAFKMAAHAHPDDLRDRRILSELYTFTERFDEAIEQQQFILQQDPLKVEPYQELYRLYLHKRSYDEAWCTASAIVFMRKANAEQQQFFDDYRPQGILQVKGRLSNEHWVKHLFHPDLNVYVSKILEAISAAALKAKITQLGPAYRLPDKKFKQDVATSTITFARTFGWAAQVLGVPMPELYVRNDQPGAISVLATEPRASEAGRAVLSGFQPQELAFICGKHLAGYRPELYLRNLFPAQSDLTVMLFAGVVIAAPNTPLPQELASNVHATAQALARFMDSQSIEYLRTVVKRFIQDGAKANIKRWNQSAELTSCRAALLVSGDLEIAKKIISAERATPDLPPAEKMKELLVFSVSEHYSALRRALGVNIPVE